MYDWAKRVNLGRFGYQHNEVVEADLQTLIDFFLEKDINVMVSKVKDSNYGYMLAVDTKLFRSG